MTAFQADNITEIRDMITETREDIRRYLPGMGRVVVRTYGVPFVALALTLLLMNVVSQLIPGLLAGGFSGNLAAVVLSGAVLVVSWRWADRRFRGSTLMVLYSQVSRERRELEKLLDQFDSNPDSIPVTAIHDQAEIYARVVDTLLESFHARGIQPVEQD